MKKSLLSAKYILLFLSLIITISSQCCSTFDSSQRYCLTCPINTHLYRGNCLINVPNCQKYSNGFDC